MMQILSIFLLVLIGLTHIIAVVADKHCAADTLNTGQWCNKIGVVLFESYFQIQLHLSGRCSLALNHTALYIGLNEFLRFVFALLIGAFQYQDLWMYMRLLIDEYQQDHANDHTADYRQRNHTGSQNDAYGNRPEQERNIQGFFNSSAETDDGQGTHHTKGQHHIGGHRQNNYGGNHGQRDEGYAEELEYITPLKVFL